MISVRSTRRLIQEEYYPDEWKVLVCCVLLNRCRGETVRKVIEELFDVYPDADSMRNAELSRLTLLLKPLGFQNRRASTLVAMATKFCEEWHDVRELPGVGRYAYDCYRIFFLEELPNDPPEDGPLTDYWISAKSGLWPKQGWGYDAEVQERKRRMVCLEQRRRGTNFVGKTTRSPDK